MPKVFSPGRVNIIGEHTDYSFGYVMPMAINLGNYFEYIPYNKIKIRSDAYNEEIELDLSEVNKKQNKWIDYVLGIYNALYKINLKPGGINGRIYGNLPISSGLSSSASIELAIITALNYTYKLNLDKIQMALIGKKAENEFVGVPSGILDQFAIEFGKRGYTIFLDTENLFYEYIPFPMDISIIVYNTGVKRELAKTEYTERKRIVEESLKYLNKKSSKEITEKELEKLNSLYKKRMGYIIRENRRVLIARDALKENNLDLLGKILVESHKDIAENYEVSSKELDFIVNRAVKYGALGARLTGAGFGGSAIILAYKDKAEIIANNIHSEYIREFKYNSFYNIVESNDGSMVVEK
ncbi:galactokinase [Caldisphaera lagunensis DSM 15908]|uniref:Galactokinase n=1 Tax=Caldisphaera lagunensis (strain DSM 15908 / JCM 11604 / ANMR 0165 / IC-154) TaxID=1056495 RepID=L0AC32_CALLD|nr:galactokinase [Caldisphaera lagunensis]AFZ70682.1 galactokinase [Caldisphaera lagunensis DSM 15908]